jgi:succinylglutamate desuccinylase
MERVLGSFQGGDSNRLIIFIGALHGNEKAGLKAISSVFADIQKHSIPVNGQVYGVAGNLQAIEADERFLNYDMNRSWQSAHMEHLLTLDVSQLTQEDLEQVQLYHLLQELSAGDYTERCLVDLHTTSADNGNFIVHPGMPADTAPVRALKLPIVINLHESLPGTLLHYMSDRGFNSFVFEGGQIGAQRAIDVHTLGVWELLIKSGFIDERDLPDTVDSYAEMVSDLHATLPMTVSVLHRHEVLATDNFKMLPGYENFQAVKQGEVLAHDVSGEVTCPVDGLIFMPLYQKAGNDGFFIVEEV